MTTSINAPGRADAEGRFVDQIWKLHSSGETLYAGVGGGPLP